jgi:hypothetical protein
MGRLVVAAGGRVVLPAATSARPEQALGAVVLLTGGVPFRAPLKPDHRANRVRRVKGLCVNLGNRGLRAREAGPGINDPLMAAIVLCGPSVLVVRMTGGPARSEVDGVVAVGGVTAVTLARRVTVIRKKAVVLASRCRRPGRPQSRPLSQWVPFQKPLRRSVSHRVFSAAFATWGTARRLPFRKKVFHWRSKGVT